MEVSTSNTAKRTLNVFLEAVERWGSPDCARLSKRMKCTSLPLNENGFTHPHIHTQMLHCAFKLCAMHLNFALHMKPRLCR